MASFQEGDQLLWELPSAPVWGKHIERTAKQAGEEISADKLGHREPGDSSPLLQTVSLGIDGTCILLRAEEVARVAGMPPDGSSTPREVKLCASRSAESLEEPGIPVRAWGSATYSAASEDAAARNTFAEGSQFAQRG